MEEKIIDRAEKMSDTELSELLEQLTILKKKKATAASSGCMDKFTKGVRVKILAGKSAGAGGTVVRAQRLRVYVECDDGKIAYCYASELTLSPIEQNDGATEDESMVESSNLAECQVGE